MSELKPTEMRSRTRTSGAATRLLGDRRAPTARKLWYGRQLRLLVLLVALGGLIVGLSACDDSSSSGSTLATRGTAAGTTAGAGTSAVTVHGTASSGSKVRDLGKAEIQEPDPAALIKSDLCGWALANIVLVVMEEGQSHAKAEQVATQIGGTIVGEIEFLNLYQIRTSGVSAHDLETVIKAAESLSGVKWAIPNGVVYSGAAVRGKTCSPMHDPAYQTGMNHVPYQMSGVLEAWGIVQASGVTLHDTKVGVSDTPVYTRSGHASTPELNFPNAAGTYPESVVRVRGLDADDTTDQQPPDEGGLTHGTKVTHIIAAEWGEGVAGVATYLRDKLEVTCSSSPYGGSGYSFPDNFRMQDLWASDLDRYASGDYGSVFVELIDQVSKGADVINLSWHFGERPDPGLLGAVALFEHFFRLMHAAHDDVLFVAAAGNHGLALDGYNLAPGGIPGLPNLITVGALDREGHRADPSDWQTQEEIAEWYREDKIMRRIPADTTLEQYVSEWLAIGSNYATGEGEITLSACGTGIVVGRHPDGTPLVGHGTSYAAPQVTAAAAILKSIDPTLTAEDMKEILVRTAGTEVNVSGTRVNVPASLGGRVLRVDRAVLEVINRMRGSNDQLIYEDLIELVTINLTAEEHEFGYLVKATTPRVETPQGVDFQIVIVGDAELFGERIHRIYNALETATWSVKPGKDPVTVWVLRLDNGACAFLELPGEDGAPGSTTTVPAVRNNAPTAENIDVTTKPGASVAITLKGSDADGDGLTYTLNNMPSNGTLSGTAPALVYKPRTGFTGTDSFTYRVNDGKVSSSVATVKIEVAGIRWVRVGSAAVNPEKLPLKFQGGGSNPTFFPEERFKDLFIIYQPSETSFTVRDRWKDREYEAWNVTITCDFSAPEAVLVPGKPYKLKATFSHTGTSKETSPGEAFTYYSPSGGIQPNESLPYYPWAKDFNGVSSKTWTFTAPQAQAGDTLEIQAGLWNAAQCTVIWTYKAQ